MIACDLRGGLMCARVVAPPALIAILTHMIADPASALDWQVGDVDVRFDTTLSQGVTVRTSERDPATIGIANGGTISLAAQPNQTGRTYSACRTNARNCPTRRLDQKSECLAAPRGQR